MANTRLFIRKDSNHANPPPENQNKQPGREHSILKTGALINIVGGAGFLLFGLVAWLGSALGPTKNEAEVTVSVDTAYPTLWNATLVILFVITALSIVILVAKIPKKSLRIVSCVQLALALFNFVASIVIWNVGICCVAWMFEWAYVLQLIGSIQCLRGIWKLDD